MAGKTFGDFSSLKGLKKELEKGSSALDSGSASASASGSGTGRPRSKTITLKTRDEHLAEQKARETGLKPGMKVTLMDSNDRGVIRHVRKDCVEVEIDGLLMRLGFNDFVVNDPEQDRMMLRGIGSAKAKKKVVDTAVVSANRNELTVDLHIERIPGGFDAPEGFELPFQLEYFKRVLRQNLKHRGMKINFVHGVGDGILRDALRKEIDEAFALTCNWAPGTAGVTIVTIR